MLESLAEALVTAAIFLLGVAGTLLAIAWRGGAISSSVHERIEDLEERNEMLDRIPRLVSKIENLVDTLDRHEALIEKLYGKLEERYQTISHCNDLHSNHSKRLDRLEDAVFDND